MSARAIERVEAWLEYQNDKTPEVAAIGFPMLRYADLRAVLAAAKRVAEMEAAMKSLGVMPCSCVPWALAFLRGDPAARKAFAPRTKPRTKRKGRR